MDFVAVLEALITWIPFFVILAVYGVLFARLNKRQKDRLSDLISELRQQGKSLERIAEAFERNSVRNEKT